MNFQSIRQQFIDEAKMSPNMLSDIAGLERYISESYNNRSFIELLQNADDANATHFLVAKEKRYLIVANNGRAFNENDLISLCRSAASQKVRGESIGYRGIGFKSIVNIAQEVHIVSGEYEISFSRKLTQEALSVSTEVPLIRIPHPINLVIKEDTFPFIAKWKEQGYVTFFIFSGIMINKIDEDFRSVKIPSLLFLRNITLLDNMLADSRVEITKQAKNSFSHETIISQNGQETNWLIYSQKNNSIAFSSSKSGRTERLKQDEALIYSFLPTEDKTGLGVLVNGDFSTDPSRRHLINDSITKSTIQDICNLYKAILLDVLSQKGDANTIVALAPILDCNLMKITGNLFEREFSTIIQDKVNLSDYVLCPTWLSLQEFLNITQKLRIKTINFDPTNTDTLVFMKYLGAKEFQLSDIRDEHVLSSVEISEKGCAKLFVHVVHEAPLKWPTCKIDNISLIFSNGRRTSLRAINDNGQSIDGEYLTILYENGLSANELKHVFSRFQLTQLIDSPLVHENHKQYLLSAGSNGFDEWYGEDGISSEDDDLSIDNPIPRWRDAERQVMNILNENHFELEDVSNQNVGYDLEGTDPYGKKVYIEVKLLDYSGAKFKMTNNEYACAQMKGYSYVLALAHFKQRKLDLVLIKDPVNSLRFNRQCVQWIWECESYSFKPHSFLLK